MYEAVFNYAQNANTAFLEPLQYSEVKAVAKSIANYCLRNDKACYSRFIERQREKGKKGDSSKGGIARSAKYADKRVTAMEMRLEGVKNVDIAKKLGVSDRTLRNWGIKSR